jgi:hypothetical protein
LEALARAVDLGYKDIQWMLEDPDLEGLRNHPAFQRLLKQIKASL